MDPKVYILYLCMLNSTHPVRKAFKHWVDGDGRTMLDCELEAMSFSKSLDARINHIYQEEQDWALMSTNTIQNFLLKYDNVTKRALGNRDEKEKKNTRH